VQLVQLYIYIYITLFCLSFPMFVPSLSWQKDRLYI
jgi:hypothetical protein